MCKTIKEGMVQLHYWQWGTNPDNYTSMLFNLYAKADSENMRRLELVYPNELMAYKVWYMREGGNLKEFIEDLIKHDNDTLDVICPIFAHSIIRITHPMDLVCVLEQLRKQENHN